jgi:SAM and SH3 domain-containing protein 1
MYDEDARMMGLAPGHWYDEPPYESDPEDFLMGGGGPVPTATFQNGRVCFTLNLRNEHREEGVISLRSAGDISLPREATRGATRRGLILPQSGPYPPAIIPLRTARDRGESGDYAGSDIQSVSSRLSGLSVESRSELGDGAHRINQTGYRPMGAYRMRRLEDGLSPHSSDYEDQEESEVDNQHVATVHNVCFFFDNYF